MGRRKRTSHKIGKCEEPVDVSAAGPHAEAEAEAQSSALIDEASVQSEDPLNTDAEMAEKVALVEEILQIQARLRELDVVLEERRERSARLEREAKAAVASCERERRRHNNTVMLEAAGLLHGRGLIDKLEERWTKASQHPDISQLKRWERWAILATEHADELQAVTMHGERLITADVLDKLVPILQELRRKCARNQGWLDDRLWIEADDLRPHGGNVLMALAKCFQLCFTCTDKGRVKSSSHKEATDDDDIDFPVWKERMASNLAS